LKLAYSSRTPTATQLCFAALLVIAVLFAQWMGLGHSIEHADQINNQHAVQNAKQSSDACDSSFDPTQGLTTEYAGDKSHSCTLFDGMALADNVAALSFIPLLQTSVQVLALWTAHASWDAPFLRYFSSRAPPAA